MSHPKRTLFVPTEAFRLLSSLSKNTLFDMAASLAVIGTDESAEQITARLCREAVIICRNRGDRITPAIKAAALRRIDSDPPAMELAAEIDKL